MLENIITELIEKHGNIVAASLYEFNNKMMTVKASLWLCFEDTTVPYCVYESNWDVQNTFPKKDLNDEVKYMVDTCRDHYNLVDAPVNAMIDRVLQEACEIEEKYKNEEVHPQRMSSHIQS